MMVVKTDRDYIISIAAAISGEIMKSSYGEGQMEHMNRAVHNLSEVLGKVIEELYIKDQISEQTIKSMIGYDCQLICDLTR